MPSFVHIDNTDDFGRVICKQEKAADLNLVYNQAQVLTDIKRMLQFIHIFIDQQPLESWINSAINSENNPSNHLSFLEDCSFSFDTILKKKKPELGPEKQQQYAVFLSRFLSQTLFEPESKYLKEHNFFVSKTILNVNIALHKEAVYIQTNFTLPVLIPENKNKILSDLDLERLQKASKSKSKEFESKTTYKIVLTEVPIDKQNLIQDTSQKNINGIKIERSLIESKLTCLKKHGANFNPHIEEPVKPPVTGNSRLPGLLRFLLDKIISFLNFIKDIFKKNNLEKQSTKEQAKEDINIYSPNIHQKEEKVKLDTLYFDPSCNKLARNLEDFLIRYASETKKSDKSDPVPLTEEVLVTTPSIGQNKDIKKEEPSLTNEDRANHQSEKKLNPMI